MDFGLGAFLEKFDEHFGPRWTKWLLVLIGISITLVCLGIIWRLGIQPVISVFGAVGPFLTQWGIVIHAAAVGTAIGAGIGIGLMLVTMFRSAQLLRLHRAQKAEFDALIDAAKAITKDAEKVAVGMEETTAHAELVIEQIIENGIKRGLLTPEQVDLLQSLVNTGLRTQP